MKNLVSFNGFRLAGAAVLCGLTLNLPVASGFASIKAPDLAPKPSKAERKQREQAAIHAAMSRGELLPLPRILTLAQARVRGDVLKVEIEQEPWGFKYEVKILAANGRVREVELNARTGAFIRIEDD